jgi:hypothetical protein
MRIGLFNNMNNNNFSLARYLRDRGHDVKLFLLDEQPQFMPENDTYDETDLQMVTSLDWYKKSHWKTSRKEILDVVQQFDFLIGTDMVPAFFYKAGVDLDLMFPHGGDIYSKPYFRYNSAISLRAQVGIFYSKLCQRRGLKRTKTICLQYLNERFEFHIRKLGLTRNRTNTVCPSIYVPQYSTATFFEKIETNRYYQEIKEIKSKHDFLIIQQGRQEHRDPVDIHYKGNEKLFYAFKKLLSHQINAHLILFEYGTDVHLSKKLISGLEIADKVTWLPIMSRKELMPILSLADVGIGILAEESYILYGSVNEFIVMEVPIIHHLDKADVLKQKVKSTYPYYNAKTTAEVYSAMIEVYFNKLTAKSAAKEGKQWFMDNVINQSLSDIEYQINCAN